MKNPHLSGSTVPQNNLSTLKEIASAFGSATWVGWAIALLMGLWGVFVGIGEFQLAYCMIVLAVVICIWRLVLQIDFFGGTPRTGAFIVCFLVLSVVAVGLGFLTNYRAQKTGMEAEKLSHLTEIPTLKGQLEELSKRNKALDENLEKFRLEAAEKAGVIEELQNLLLKQGKQNGEIGVGTDKDVLGEPASSAKPKIQYVFSTGDFGVFVENTGERSMFDVSIHAEEMSLNEFQKGYITDMKRKNRWTVVLPSVRPKALVLTTIHLPYVPPNCDGWRITISSRGGGDSETIYKRIGSSNFDPRNSVPAKPDPDPEVEYQFLVNGKVLEDKNVHIRGEDPF